MLNIILVLVICGICFANDIKIRGYDIKYYLDFIVDNKITSSILAIILILYAGLLVPTLSYETLLRLNQPCIKLLMLFLIAYYTSKSMQIAILLSLIFYLSMQALSNYEMNQKIRQIIVADIRSDEDKENDKK